MNGTITPAVARRFTGSALLLITSAVSSAAEITPNRFVSTPYNGPEATVSQLLQADLNDKEAQFLLTRLAENHDDFEEAVDLLEDAAEAAPDKALTQLRFGQASCQLAGHPETGMLSKAGLAGDCREAFEAASKLEPTLLNAWRGLFDFYRMAPGIVGGGVEKAEAVIGKIAAIDAAEAELARASLAVQAEKPAAVREHFAKAIALKPAKADEYRFQEALILMRLEDYSAAYETLKNLRGSATVDEAQLQYQTGRIAVLASHANWYSEAEQSLLDYLNRADLTAEHPTKPWAAFRLGQLYELMGKPEQSRSRYQWAASQQPDNRLKTELKKKGIKV